MTRTPREEGDWATSRQEDKTGPLYIATGSESIVLSVAQAASPYLANQRGVLSHEWPDARTRTLQIGLPSSQGGALTFPPPSPNGGQHGSLQCGMLDSLGVALGSGPYLACVLEYGGGSVARRLYFDWLQGSYNIPASKYVRVSALPWGPDGWTVSGAVYALAAAVVTDNLQGACVPTVTATGNVAAATPRTFQVPDGARAFEVYNAGAATPIVTLSGGIVGTRNFAAGAFNPPYSPLAVPRQTNTVTVTVNVDCTLSLQWFLEL